MLKRWVGNSYYNKYCQNTIGFDRRIQTILARDREIFNEIWTGFIKLSGTRSRLPVCFFLIPCQGRQLDISGQRSMERPLPSNEWPNQGENCVQAKGCKFGFMWPVRKTNWAAQGGLFFTAPSNIIDRGGAAGPSAFKGIQWSVFNRELFITAAQLEVGHASQPRIPHIDNQYGTRFIIFTVAQMTLCQAASFILSWMKNRKKKIWWKKASTEKDRKKVICECIMSVLLMLLLMLVQPDISNHEAD